MAWPFLNGVIKVVVTFGFDGVPSVNVHFVLLRTPSSPVPEASLEAVADAFWSAYDTEWKSIMGDQWDIDNITATDWSLDDGQQIQTSEALPITGVAAVEEVPASISLVVSHRTNHTGRSRRGRTFLPGFTEGNIGGNGVDGNGVTAAGDLFDAIDTALGVISTDHIVYSLVDGGAPRSVPLATLVTSRIINSRVDTQRRRLPV